MRQSIGSTWVLQLMILFILLFVAFIILTLNYSKTVKMKNEVLSIVEKYEGLNEQSLTLVNNFLMSSGYGVMNECTDVEKTGIYGAFDLYTNTLEKAEPGKKYYYCVKKYKGTNTSKYYQITLFYRFNLPVIGDTARFSIRGTTSNFQPFDDVRYEEVIGD